MNNTPQDAQKRQSSKAATSEGPRRTLAPLRYVEGLNDARTPLAAFFSILLPDPLDVGETIHRLDQPK